MPLTALWSLIVSLILLAFGLSLKLAHVSHALKLADKELDSLIKQITLLKEKHEEAVSSTSQFKNAESDKIIKYYETQINYLIDKVVELKSPQQTSLANLHYLPSSSVHNKNISLADLGQSIVHKKGGQP